MDESLRDNPRALEGAPTPRIGHWPANGTSLYAEVRGAGPTILLIPGGAEDAEGWRPVAERLVGYTVVTYDRRGTLRSGREDWPGHGSAQHADDAAALLRALGLEEVTVLGGSSAGIIALQIALRHSGLVRLALVYEPGCFGVVPQGTAIQRPANAAVQAHLDAHPEDWAGAYAEFGRAVAATTSSALGHPFAPPPGMDWYDRREEINAEPLVRDDIPILTAESVDEIALTAAAVEIRFAYGMRSMAIFREIVEHLAAIRGQAPDAIEGVGHAIYFYPDEAAAYIGAMTGRRP